MPRTLHSEKAAVLRHNWPRAKLGRAAKDYKETESNEGLKKDQHGGLQV